LSICLSSQIPRICIGTVNPCMSMVVTTNPNCYLIKPDCRQWRSSPSGNRLTTRVSRFGGDYHLCLAMASGSAWVRSVVIGDWIVVLYRYFQSYNSDYRSNLASSINMSNHPLLKVEISQLNSIHLENHSFLE
jgi:hypothetical protein